MTPSPDGTVSLGAVLDKLIALGGTYRECRAAALAGQPPE